MVYEFELILEDTHGVVDDLTGDAVMEMADALYEAGCDDCTPGKSCGVISVGFHREAENLEEAILSAIRNVQSAGYRVQQVRPDRQSLFDRVNQQLASGTVA